MSMEGIERKSKPPAEAVNEPSYDAFDKLAAEENDAHEKAGEARKGLSHEYKVLAEQEFSVLLDGFDSETPDRQALIREIQTRLAMIEDRNLPEPVIAAILGHGDSSRGGHDDSDRSYAPDAVLSLFSERLQNAVRAYMATIEEVDTEARSANARTQSELDRIYEIRTRLQGNSERPSGEDS